VGLGGVEPPTSALSVLVTGTAVTGMALAGTRFRPEGQLRAAANGLARAMDARCSVIIQRGCRPYERPHRAPLHQHRPDRTAAPNRCRRRLGKRHTGQGALGDGVEGGVGGREIGTEGLVKRFATQA
jgi:hypothetical protein